MRRAILLVAMMALTLLAVSGVALGATRTPPGPFTLWFADALLEERYAVYGCWC